MIRRPTPTTTTPITRCAPGQLLVGTARPTTERIPTISEYGLGAANTTRATAGVSGGTFDAWQFGVGIADNEFAANNPSTASGQSVSMAPVQAILNAGKGAADSTHHYWGVLITNNMLDGTAAIAANGPGKWGALLDGTNAAITSAGNGIIMPRGTPGSRVVYKPSTTQNSMPPQIVTAGSPTASKS